VGADLCAGAEGSQKPNARAKRPGAKRLHLAEPTSDRQAAAMRRGAHRTAHAHAAHSIFDLIMFTLVWGVAHCLQITFSDPDTQFPISTRKLLYNTWNLGSLQPTHLLY
jgi:hypothetical protein